MEDHFHHRDATRPIFDQVVTAIEHRVGDCEVVAIPCCIRLCGTHDFLAVLPRKDRLEVRFTLDHEVDDPRIVQSTQVSRSTHKHSVDLRSPEEVDEEFLDWVAEAYHRQDA